MSVISPPPPGPPSDLETDIQLRELYGRQFNGQIEAYMLPADAPEHNRLKLQHDSLRLYRGALYANPSLVRAVLTEDKGVQRGCRPRPMILDVGTGTGRWAIEMAQEFPNADVVGFDVVPPAVLPNEGLPPNCRLLVKDLNGGMTEWENQIDVLHARSVEGGVDDFDSFLYDCARCLKPNGILLLSTGSVQFYNDKLEPFPSLEEGVAGFTWTQWLFSSVHDAYLQRGHPSIATDPWWPQWLKNNPNYQDVVKETLYIPQGLWRKGLNDHQSRAAVLSRESFLSVAQAFRPLFISAGIPATKIDRAIEGHKNEMLGKRLKAYSSWNYVTAVRKDSSWKPRLGSPRQLDSDRRMLKGY